MGELDRDAFRESFHNFMRKGGAEETAKLFMRPYDEQLPLWDEALQDERLYNPDLEVGEGESSPEGEAAE